MKSIAVIGAGIAGLVCARQLRRAGHRVQVFDKGVSLGGRTASRRQWGTLFNHGAPWFEVRSQQFRDELKEGLGSGALRQLAPELVQIEGGRASRRLDNRWIFSGWPTMNRFAYHLAADVTVSSGFAVNRICRQAQAHGPHAWQLQVDRLGSTEAFDHVVLAIPAPQALRLLPAGHAWQDMLAEVEMVPVVTSMVMPQHPLDLDWDGARFTDGPLDSAIFRRGPARDGLRDRAGEMVILHATHDWSRRHLEEDPTTSARQLVEAFAAAVGPLGDLRHLRGHRWRYARTATPLGQEYLLDRDLRLALCGDWCLGSRLEDAWTSGSALARSLLANMGAARHHSPPASLGMVH